MFIQNRTLPADLLAQLVGMGIDYTGDMANPSGQGAIVRAWAEGQQQYIDAILDDGRLNSRIPLGMLGTPEMRNGCAVRFIVTGPLHGAPYLAQIAAAAAMRKANNAAAATIEKSAYALAVERIKAENPALEVGQYSKTAAKNIRAELKAAFKGVKFSVRCDHSSINIGWTDGPTPSAVEAITRKYKAGHFDGMTDCYEYSRSAWGDTFGSAQYIFDRRECSDALILRSIAALVAEYGDFSTPTLEDFRAGRAYNSSPIINASNYDSWQCLIHRKAAELAA